MRTPGLQGDPRRARERRRHLRWARRRAVDVLIVSLGSTAGLRAPTSELADSLARAGRERRRSPRRRRRPRAVATLMLTDLALGARGARGRARARWRGSRARPRAIIYSTTTAALLWPRAGRDPLRRAVGRQPARAPRPLAAPARAPAAGRGAAAAAVERGRARARPGLAARSRRARARAPGRRRAVRARCAARGTSPRSPTRRTRRKKGLDRVLAAWRAAAPRRRGRGGGAARRRGAAPTELRARRACDRGREEGVRVRGGSRRERVPRAAAPRARVRLRAAPRGLRHRPARGAGRRLPARDTAAPGPYAALPIARELDARLVGEDLAAALRRRARRPAAGLRRARAARRSRRSAAAAVDRARRRAATAAPACRSGAQLRQRAGVRDVLAPSARRAARSRRPSACSRACRARWASESITITTPAPRRPRGRGRRRGRGGRGSR